MLQIFLCMTNCHLHFCSYFSELAGIIVGSIVLVVIVIVVVGVFAMRDHLPAIKGSKAYVRNNEQFFIPNF